MRFVIGILIFAMPFVVWAEESPHFDIPIAPTAVSMFTWFLGICIMIIGYFVKKTLDHVDANSKENREQWKVIASMNSRLSNMEGEHNVFHGRTPVMTDPRRPGDPAVRWVKDEDLAKK